MTTRNSYLIINSENRVSTSVSTTDFQYYLGQPLLVSRIDIKTITIPNTQYNITLNNNIMEVQIQPLPDNPAEFILQPGQYSTNQIMTLLIYFFTERGITFTWEQDPNSLRLYLTTSVPVDFLTCQLLTDLGQPTSTVRGTSFSFSTMPHLQGLLNYYLITNVLSDGGKGLFSNGRQDSFMTNIGNTVPFGTINHYEPTVIDTNSIFFGSPVNIQTIDIKLVDRNLNVVDLNGSDVEMVFKIYTPLTKK